LSAAESSQTASKPGTGAAHAPLDLTDRMEDYLKTIASLSLGEGVAKVSDVAAAQKVKVPTASEAIGQLTKRGLVEHESYGAVDLTPEGWRVANDMLDRHGVLLHLFSDILGLAPDAAETEACAVEHAIAGQTLELVAEFVARHAHRLPVQPERPARAAAQAAGADVAETEAELLRRNGGKVPIDEDRIFAVLQESKSRDAAYVRGVIAKALELKGLDEEEVAALAQVSDSDLLGELFAAARKVKEQIYGSRLVMFAPLYISNLCGNECLYCAFRARNKEIKRRALTQDEIRHEVGLLIDQGHKRVLLVAGESYPKEGLDYVLRSIETVYSVKRPKGEIRRVNVNIAPLTVEEFKRLKTTGIGTYQIFQETYHHQTYARMHVAGKKKDYEYRITAPDRAMQAGVDDVGIGVLFGLFDWRFEILALLQHIRHLEDTYGVGPHTLSVPRLEPAVGSDYASHPPYAVSDIDFRKLVAILRLAVPYTGIIMSTRETPNIRRETFALGVSQISGGSRTNPGGYAEDEEFEAQQFQMGDHRSLDEVMRDVAKLGYTPSFCTACYRLGRTGRDFMDLAKPGEIRLHCQPNALSSFEEYLLDFASPETQRVGEERIAEELAHMDSAERKVAEGQLARVREGKRDVYR
jgi:2-iminoacetate synthase